MADQPADARAESRRGTNPISPKQLSSAPQTNERNVRSQVPGTPVGTSPCVSREKVLADKIEILEYLPPEHYLFQKTLQDIVSLCVGSQDFDAALVEDIVKKFKDHGVDNNKVAPAYASLKAYAADRIELKQIGSRIRTVEFLRDSIHAIFDGHIASAKGKSTIEPEGFFDNLLSQESVQCPHPGESVNNLRKQRQEVDFQDNTEHDSTLSVENLDVRSGRSTKEKSTQAPKFLKLWNDRYHAKQTLGNSFENNSTIHVATPSTTKSSPLIDLGQEEETPPASAESVATQQQIEPAEQNLYNSERVVNRELERPLVSQPTMPTRKFKPSPQFNQVEHTPIIDKLCGPRPFTFEFRKEVQRHIIQEILRRGRSEEFVTSFRDPNPPHERLNFDLVDHGKGISSKISGIFGTPNRDPATIRTALEHCLQPFVIENEDKFRDVLGSPAKSIVQSRRAKNY